MFGISKHVNQIWTHYRQNMGVSLSRFNFFFKSFVIGGLGLSLDKSMGKMRLTCPCLVHRQNRSSVIEKSIRYLV